MPLHHEEQFLEAYDAHADSIFRFCFAQCGNRDVAQDLTQEAFVRTWKYLTSGRHITQLKSFLYRTARNTFIDYLRQHKTVSLELMYKEGFDQQDTQILAPDISAEAMRAVHLMVHLEPTYREAVTLRYVNELSPRDVARILGISVSNASVRINRGLQKLRDLMDISIPKKQRP